MAVQLGALREALLNPGNADLANKAAEEVAGYESQFVSIKVELAAIRGEQTLMKWMLATVLAANLSIILKLFVL